MKETTKAMIRTARQERKRSSPYYANRALAIVQKYFPKVTVVKDLEKDQVFEVTSADVKSAAGGRKRHAECAAALACVRQFHLDGAIISRSRGYLVKGTTATRGETTAS